MAIAVRDKKSRLCGVESSGLSPLPPHICGGLLLRDKLTDFGLHMQENARRVALRQNRNNQKRNNNVSIH